MINDTDAAKDIVQNVFLRFWQMKGNLLIETTAEAYLYKSVINETLGYIKKHKRSAVTALNIEANNVAGNNHVGHETDGRELEEEINKLLAQLPPKCQQVFLLSRFENMTYKEIAITLNISAKTVEHHIAKALSFLRKGIQNPH